jgi:hypothetical protein
VLLCGWGEGTSPRCTVRSRRLGLHVGRRRRPPHGSALQDQHGHRKRDVNSGLALCPLLCASRAFLAGLRWPHAGPVTAVAAA